MFAHEEMAFYEVQDYMIFAQQSQFVATLIGNADWYDGLSAEQQKMINGITKTLVREGHDIQSRYNEERLETIKSKSDINIIELTEAQRNAFREKAKPVRQVYIDEVGARGEQSLGALLSAFDKAAKGE